MGKVHNFKYKYFVSKNAITLTIVAPSGKSYTFTKDKPTIVRKAIDIKFFENRDDLVTYNPSVKNETNTSIYDTPKKNRIKPLPITGLLTEDQLDSKYLDMYKNVKNSS